MTIPFSDLAYVNDGVLDDFVKEVRQIFENGQFTLGPSVQKFEESFAKYIGNRFCIGVGCGADALTLALRAMGVGAGHEVIVPVYGPITAASAVARTGATVAFVDVRPETCTIDTDKTLATINSNTRAVIPVHLHGIAVEIDRLVNIARTYSVQVVEDARQAVGGRIGNRRLGTYGDFGAFSFRPDNPLGAAGDGGALTTNNEDRATLVRRLRDQGRLGDEVYELVGYTSRLDALQAALLLIKLQDLDEYNAERVENARLYDRLFMGSPVRTPPFIEDGPNIYSTYVVQAPERDKLAAHLQEKGIGCEIPLARPLHLQPCFAHLGYRQGAFPIAEDIARQALALPNRPGLKKRQIEEIAETILNFYGVRA